MPSTELAARLDAQLLAAQTRQEAVGAALVSGQPGVLEAAAAQLQAAISALTQTVEAVKREGPLAAALRQRLVEMSQRLALHREACLRRGAVVERSLLPAPYTGPQGAAGMTDSNERSTTAPRRRQASRCSARRCDISTKRWRNAAASGPSRFTASTVCVSAAMAACN